MKSQPCMQKRGEKNNTFPNNLFKEREKNTRTIKSKAGCTTKELLLLYPTESLFSFLTLCPLFQCRYKMFARSLASPIHAIILFRVDERASERERKWRSTTYTHAAKWPSKPFNSFFPLSLFLFSHGSASSRAHTKEKHFMHDYTFSSNMCQLPRT